MALPCRRVASGGSRPQFDISPFRANRLIALAVDKGLVRTVVDGPIAGCVAFEKQMQDDFGLRFCRVVPDRHIDAFRALGAAAGACLNAVLDQASHRMIGIGHGRTLASINQNVPARSSTEAEFVALLGSLPSRISSYPFEAIDHLTDRTGALAHLIPAPLYADTPESTAASLLHRDTRSLGRR